MWGKIAKDTHLNFLTSIWHLQTAEICKDQQSKAYLSDYFGLVELFVLCVGVHVVTGKDTDEVLSVCDERGCALSVVSAPRKQWEMSLCSIRQRSPRFGAL